MRGSPRNSSGAIARWCWVALFFALVTSAHAAETPILTNAQQVLDLGLDRARPGDIPLRLRGVLTYQSVNRTNWFFVQDDSAAILIITPELPFALSAGQLIEIEGQAAAGIWMPFVNARQMKLLGTAPLPEPRRSPPEQLAAGTNFGHWVQLEGTVRDVAVSKDRLLLYCAENGWRYQVWITHTAEMPIPTNLLDARLRMHGVSWIDVAYDRQPFGFKLHLSSTNFMRVLSPGSAEIYDRPLRTVQSLRRFNGNQNARVKVSGVVTLHTRTGWIYLNDDTGPLLARTLGVLPRDDDPRGKFLQRDRPALKPGDRIEVVGAPVAGRTFSPSLEDAEYRVVGHTEPLAARAVSASDLMTGRHDAELVVSKARVVDSELYHNREWYTQRLWLRGSDTDFEATLTTHEKPRSVRRNDFVSVTGVCVAVPGKFRQVRSFSLYMRAPGDLVTTPAPWWTSRWIEWIAGAVALVTTASVIWIFLLRRQVARRTADLSAANALLQDADSELRAALAAEKELSQLKSNFVSMVSHEFRTPLGAIQSSAELLQTYRDRLTSERQKTLLDVIVNSSSDMARMMEDVQLLSRVDSARYEFHPRESALHDFCQRVVDEVTSATGCRCQIDLSIDAPETAWCDEGLLRHIFNNLLSNAVKYSPPDSPVKFSVARDGNDAVFTVKDGGIGISAADQARLFTAFTRGANVGQTPGCGLGLVIVQRCVSLHHGSVRLESELGHGTTATVRLPLFVAPESDTAFLRRRRAEMSASTSTTP